MTFQLIFSILLLLFLIWRAVSVIQDYRAGVANFGFQWPNKPIKFERSIDPRGFWGATLFQVLIVLALIGMFYLMVRS